MVGDSGYFKVFLGILKSTQISFRQQENLDHHLILMDGGSVLIIRHETLDLSYFKEFRGDFQVFSILLSSSYPHGWW